MPRDLFDQEIQKAKDEIQLLGRMVEDAIISSVSALRKHDLRAAQQIIEKDAAVNAKRFELENYIISIIAKQQPTAHDLRVLASIFEVTGELERIGDYAKGIAILTIRIGGHWNITQLSDLPMMAELSMSMLHRSLDAFVAEDDVTASSIPDEDDLVDNLYLQFYRVMITYVLENPASLEEINYLLWVAHNLERAADRVLNICQRTIFIVTGEIGQLARYKSEESSVQ